MQPLALAMILVVTDRFRIGPAETCVALAVGPVPRRRSFAIVAPVSRTTRLCKGHGSASCFFLGGVWVA
jgi:hypothetical protein